MRSACTMPRDHGFSASLQHHGQVAAACCCQLLGVMGLPLGITAGQASDAVPVLCSVAASGSPLHYALGVYCLRRAGYPCLHKVVVVCWQVLAAWEILAEAAGVLGHCRHRSST